MDEILARLKDFDPMLAGTFPLGIEIEGSDFDIICHARNLQDFQKIMRELFGHHEGFTQRSGKTREPSVITSFKLGANEVEIFSQDIPTREQNAVRHMQIEARLLKFAKPEAREAIRALKRAGLKTEPAFAQLFQIEGEPYRGSLADKRSVRRRRQSNRRAVYAVIKALTVSIHSVGSIGF